HPLRVARLVHEGDVDDVVSVGTEIPAVLDHVSDDLARADADPDPIAHADHVLLRLPGHASTVPGSVRKRSRAARLSRDLRRRQRAAVARATAPRPGPGRKELPREQRSSSAPSRCRTCDSAPPWAGKEGAATRA